MCEKDRLNPSPTSGQRGSYVLYSIDFIIRLFLENGLLLSLS